MNLGIIGRGFVGSAVANGFNKDCNQIIVDPEYTDNTIEDVLDCKLVFVCVPTPVSEDGSCDTTIANDVLTELNRLQYKGVVVIKSTIIPDYLHEFKKEFELKIVYNPEFLTEANSFEDFLNPKMQVLGGKWKDCEAVEKAYIRHSSVKIVPTFKVDLITASLIKYTINSWLATKVTFFNELNDLFNKSGTKVPWENFIDMLTRDERMGDTHMQVPGTDGKSGFGGHCFPKDTEALLYYAKLKKGELAILKTAIDKNKKIRQ